jgi:hypothetical protein
MADREDSTTGDSGSDAADTTTTDGGSKHTPPRTTEWMYDTTVREEYLRLRRSLFHVHLHKRNLVLSLEPKLIARDQVTETSIYQLPRLAKSLEDTFERRHPQACFPAGFHQGIRLVWRRPREVEPEVISGYAIYRNKIVENEKHHTDGSRENISFPKHQTPWLPANRIGDVSHTVGRNQRTRPDLISISVLLTPPVLRTTLTVTNRMTSNLPLEPFLQRNPT